MTNYVFQVGENQYEVEAESAGYAMEWMNRNVMDQLNAHPFAWYDSIQPNTFYAASGNNFD
jgi:hypothetical protein